MHQQSQYTSVVSSVVSRLYFTAAMCSNNSAISSARVATESIVGQDFICLLAFFVIREIKSVRQMLVYQRHPLIIERTFRRETTKTTRKVTCTNILVRPLLIRETTLIHNLKMDLGYGNSATLQSPPTQSTFSQTPTRPTQSNFETSFETASFSLSLTESSSPLRVHSSSELLTPTRFTQNVTISSIDGGSPQRASAVISSKPSSTTAVVTTASSITNAQMAPPTATDPVGTTNVPSGLNLGRIMAVLFASLGVATLLAAMLVVMVCRRKRRRRHERATGKSPLATYCFNDLKRMHWHIVEPVVFVTPVPTQAKTVSRRSTDAPQHFDREIGTASEARDAAHLRLYAGGVPRGHRQETDGGLRLDMGPDVCLQQSVGTIRSENTTTSTSIETLPPPYARYD